MYSIRLIRMEDDQRRETIYIIDWIVRMGLLIELTVEICE